MSLHSASLASSARSELSSSRRPFLLGSASALLLVLCVGCGGSSVTNPGSAPVTNNTQPWTAVAGSSTVGTNGGQSGNYGTRGTPATSNAPGGREDAVSWTDQSGNFWLFGGDGFDATGNNGLLNDLWEFNPTTKTWVWVAGSSTFGTLGANGVLGSMGTYGTQGTPATTNTPGGREAAISWIDTAGNLWLFGGQGIDSSGNLGLLNDLWEFNPTNTTWVWVTGSNVGNAIGIYGTHGTPATTNTPGQRSDAVSWVDASGNLWLFGGSGLDAAGDFGPLNDLWEFNPTTKTWVWVTGSNMVGAIGGQPGVYGTLGTGATTNTPGSRSGAVSWVDPSGNLWLFGGNGLDANGNFDLLNDLWKFNPTATTWAWIGGSNMVDATGVYGTPAATIIDVPGARLRPTPWTDTAGNLWLFGGNGLDANGNLGLLNDLWEFHPSTQIWTWMSGNNTLPSLNNGQPGVYGSLGVASTSNTPGGRNGAVPWRDSSGNLWLFGGTGVDASGVTGTLNDLWQVQP